jgi:hypothetical protein
MDLKRIVFKLWGTSIIGQRNDDGTWSKEILLAPGVYQYKFLVDDEWMEDQNNPNVAEDPFGGRNSILEIN